MTSYLDLETTGLSHDDRIFEVGVIDDSGAVLFHSIINPQRPIPLRISKLTGTSNIDFTNAPVLDDILPDLRPLLINNSPVVIYNAAFDRRFFPADFWSGVEVRCAREAFREVARGDGTLEVAASWIGYNWSDQPHRAIEDARACRAVWRWVEQERKKVDDTLHNRSPHELAQLAWEAYRRCKDAEEDLEKYKTALIERAQGGKLSLEVPNVCKVSISAPPKAPDKKTYILVNELFYSMQPDMREYLVENGIVKEKKVSEEPRRPVIRFAPVATRGVRGETENVL